MKPKYTVFMAMAPVALVMQNAYTLYRERASDASSPRAENGVVDLTGWDFHFKKVL